MDKTGLLRLGMTKPWYVCGTSQGCFCCKWFTTGSGIGVHILALLARLYQGFLGNGRMLSPARLVALPLVGKIPLRSKQRTVGRPLPPGVLVSSLESTDNGHLGDCPTPKQLLMHHMERGCAQEGHLLWGVVWKGELDTGVGRVEAVCLRHLQLLVK